MGSNDCCFPWTSIWKQKIPPWVAFFLWGNSWRLAIYEKGRFGNWISVICASVMVKLDHLFLRCLVAMDLRSLVLGLFGVSWVMPKSVVGLLACWQGWFGPPWNVHIWIIIPHCLMWCLWRERNCRCLTHTNNFGLVVCLAKPIILFYLWLSWFL